MSFPQARYAFRRARYTPGDRDLLHACFPPLEKRFSAPADGKQASVIGWTEPERISFPATIGNRTVYHVVDIAGHFIQPHYFRTQTVEFGIGSELRVLNLLLLGGAADKTGSRDLVTLVDSDRPHSNPCFGAAQPPGV